MAILSNFDSSSNIVSLEGYELGDVESFASSDIELDETWLKCDGSNVDESKYPELSQYLTNKIDPSSSGWTVKKINNNTKIKLMSIYYYDGLWVGCGYTQANNYPCILYTTDPSSTWTTKTLQSSIIYTNSIYCYNGTWVICGATGTGLPIIYYTNDPTGTWTYKQISTSGGNTNSCDSIYCYNGMWVITHSKTNGYPVIYYTTDPTGTWTRTEVQTGYYAGIHKVYCYNGIWVLCLCSNVNSYPARIWYTTDPSGTWTQQNIDTSVTVQITDIYHHNGLWVASGKHYSSNFQYFFYSKDLTGTWSSFMSDFSTTNFNGAYTYPLYCHNGTWLMGSTSYSTNGTSTIYLTYSNDLSKGYQVVALHNKVGTYAVLTDIYGNEDTVCIAAYGDNSSEYPYILYNKGKLVLPNTSSTNPNTYVKAK